MKQAEELIYVIQSITRNIRELKEKEIENMELQDFSFSYFRYIEAVNMLEKPTFVELTMKMGLSKPTVTIMVNKLIDKGFIQKTKSPEDGRIYYLSLTAKGKEIIDSYNDIYKKYTEQIADRFNKKEMDILISLLKRM